MANDGSALFSSENDALLPSKEEKKPTEKPSEKLIEKPIEENNTYLKFQEIGVWTIMQEFSTKPFWKMPSHAIWEYGKGIVELLLPTFRFVVECWGVAPHLMLGYLLCSFWSSTESTVGLYYSSRLLNIIQESITNRQVNTRALLTAVLTRIGFTLANSVVNSVETKITHVLTGRIRYIFEERLIAASLRLDFPTFESPETADKINRYFATGSRGGAWELLEQLIKKLKTFSSVLSQFGFLYATLKSSPGGHWFAFICVGKALLDNLSFVSLWHSTSYVWDSNPFYRRMRSLVHMVTDSRYRIEIISDGVAAYIQKEWLKARKGLGDTSDEYPDELLRVKKAFRRSFLDAITEDFPLIFYALQVYLSPEKFSMTSIALMQQASSTLTWTLYEIFNDRSSLREILDRVNSLSKLGSIPNKLEDGKLRYAENSEKVSSGMEIKFENVSFGYKEDETVIKDVSFTIQKGQTVVIVGVNGSGKSTLLKLFNRLHDPTSGTISVDGIPLKSFVAATVRKATALMFQTYTHYPLSIRENIRLGLPDDDCAASIEGEKQPIDDPVMAAARLGGSTELISEQPKGMDAVLQPQVYSYGSYHSTDTSKTFQEKMTEIKKPANVSSGQWQRLALTRLFYRAAGKDTKLVAVDEPSASLDPKMEYELFESLRALSTAHGKTMIFVTHRFGHLTKRADLILVMEKGKLIQQGKHNELMDLGGEYATLYNLQAEAFLSEEESK